MPDRCSGIGVSRLPAALAGQRGGEAMARLAVTVAAAGL